ARGRSIERSAHRSAVSAMTPAPALTARRLRGAVRICAVTTVGDALDRLHVHLGEIRFGDLVILRRFAGRPAHIGSALIGRRRRGAQISTIGNRTADANTMADQAVELI